MAIINRSAHKALQPPLGIFQTSSLESSAPAFLFPGLLTAKLAATKYMELSNSYLKSLFVLVKKNHGIHISLKIREI